MRTTLAIAIVGAAAWSLAEETRLPARADELAIKREAVFEFARRPTVTRNGDRVTMEFETKGLCDVTVAIENAAGGILRHLAGGVLGPRAPEPFQKDSRQQTIVWDGKDDEGRYLDGKESLAVRVSLGLQPRFEQTLFWSPHKRIPEGEAAARADDSFAPPQPHHALHSRPRVSIACGPEAGRAQDTEGDECLPEPVRGNSG